MAKDDYFALVYRVLAYLYACMKQQILFEKDTFQAAVKKHVKSEEYFADVLRRMQQDGLITGLSFRKAWGREWLLLSDVEDAEITSKGIEYLEENSAMKRVGESLKLLPELIGTLIKMLWP